MRYAIVSDIHGNYEALKAVMNDIAKKKVDKIISLGDIVGYGPQPHECIKVIRKNKIQTVLGNHDAGIVYKTDISLWRREAVETWNDARYNLLDLDELDWIKKLPYYYYENNFMCVHGSPRDPITEYIRDTFVVKDNLDYMMRPICFFGHTHIPIIYEVRNNKVKTVYFTHKISIIPGRQYFINPGSVGQPRTYDVRASYVIYDVDACTVELVRVSYAIRKTQNLILKRGYSPWLATRLDNAFAVPKPYRTLTLEEWRNTLKDEEEDCMKQSEDFWKTL